MEDVVSIRGERAKFFGRNGSDGYGRAPYGDSIVQTVSWNDEGVEAYGFFTYSQSTDPASPFFANLIQLYSDKDWYRWPFTETEIEAAKISKMQLSK